jgi:hypothetical protein
MLERVDTVAGGVEAGGERRLDPWPILRVDPCQKHVGVDARVGGQAPYAFEARVPLERAGRKIPGVGR